MNKVKISHMSRFKSVSGLKVILVVAVIFIVSCSRKSDTPVYEKFVSKEIALQLTLEYMNSMVDIAAQSYPGVAAIKPLIASDVTVYKIKYKTTVDNQGIQASGLVCVPSNHGTYPILSFQNGTNTVNANAPSMNPGDFSFQMIEMIASMGYVVVVPDYPGFGASSTIPHPYLIKETTVTSIIDMFSSVREFVPAIDGIKLENAFYLLGYSQGGWATLALHKALELDYSSDFTLAGSACGAGPYDLYKLMQGMIEVNTYTMPVYIGYIVNAYSYYDQFSNPVTDIFNEPYASLLSTLYTGQLTSGEINNQLTSSIPELLNTSFLAGYESDPKYSSVRAALGNNSVTAWQTAKPLLLVHGASDVDVSPTSTEEIYTGMLDAGTPQDLITKVIIPGADHSQGIVPAILQGIEFLNNIKNTK
jgi:pimeloyl-ACP methyl ester carboxylesterase